MKHGDEKNGALPDGWALTTLGELLSGIQPGFASGKHSSDGVGLPHLRPMNVSRDGRIDRSDLRSVAPELAAKPTRRLRRGDVLFNNTNSLELVGKTALFDDDDAPAFSNHMTRLRVHQEFAEPVFIAQLLHGCWRSGDFQRLANNHVSQASVGRETLIDLPVALPPVAEQRRIAARLEEIEKRRAPAAARLQTARAVVERLRSAVLVAACSGRLTGDWREAHPDTAAADITLSDSQVPRLFDSPENWRWSSLESVAEIRGGIQVGAQRKTAETLREVPYLRVANVQRGWLDLSEVKTIAASEDKIAALQLQPGDIFFNEGGDRDKLGRGWVWEGQIDECIHQNHVFRARLHDDGFEPRFFSWFGNSFGTRYFIEEGKQTVNLASLSKKRLGRLPVPVPPHAEQSEIVRRVDAMLAAADRLAAQIDGTAAMLDRVSKASFGRARRGELVPTEAALAEEDGREYETADEMLARIIQQPEVPRARSRRKARTRT